MEGGGGRERAGVGRVRVLEGSGQGLAGKEGLGMGEGGEDLSRQAPRFRLTSFQSGSLFGRLAPLAGLLEDRIFTGRLFVVFTLAVFVVFSLR